MNSTRLSDLRDYYDLMDGLAHRTGGPLTLSACSGRMKWPKRGVYFFMEEGERRSDTGSGPRIVRVGTHALTSCSRTQLWTRLSQHRGRMKSGGGNHRGSIFRLIVGTALMKAHDQAEATWGRDKSAVGPSRDAEATLERAVSDVIGKMPFLTLPIDDEPGAQSLRGRIERGSIALLSNFGKEPIDAASDGWLGHSCNRERVRRSGLWNQNHVEESYDRTFLSTLETLVAKAEAIV